MMKFLFRAALVTVTVGLAVLLGLRSSPSRAARLQFEHRFPAESFELRFGPQTSRGVICGQYRRGATRSSEGWGPFVYVSHYSSDSPAADKLTLDSDARAAELLVRHGCL